MAAGLEQSVTAIEAEYHLPGRCEGSLVDKNCNISHLSSSYYVSGPLPVSDVGYLIFETMLQASSCCLIEEETRVKEVKGFFRGHKATQVLKWPGFQLLTLEALLQSQCPTLENTWVPRATVLVPS